MQQEQSTQRAIHLAMYALPGIAVIAVVVSSWFARTGDTMAARIYGGPPGPDRVLSWRVVLQRRDRGYYDPVPNIPLVVRVLAGDQSAQTEGVTDDEGAWEVRLPLPPGACSTLSVIAHRRDDPRPLATGDVPVAPALWSQSFGRVDALLSGRRSGDLRIEVAALRGIMAAPFPDQILIRVSRPADAADVANASISLSAQGVDLPKDTNLRTDAFGRLLLRLTPTFHSPTIEIRATDEAGVQGAFEGVLPVQAGALWLDPDALARGRIEVASPVGHRHAYITVFNRNARLFATRLDMTADADGGARGGIALPPLPDGDLWLLTSPDPQGQGVEAQTVAWPLTLGTRDEPRPSARDGARVLTPLLLDGVPTMTANLRSDAVAGRFRAMLILAAAALLESVLLAWRARQARRELELLLASHADIDEALTKAMLGGSRFWIKLVIAALVIAVGFTAMALVTWLGAA